MPFPIAGDASDLGHDGDDDAVTRFRRQSRWAVVFALLWVAGAVLLGLRWVTGGWSAIAGWAFAVVSLGLVVVSVLWALGNGSSRSGSPH